MPVSLELQCSQPKTLKMDRRIIYLFILFILPTLSIAQLKIGGKVSFTQVFVNSEAQLYDNVNDFVIYSLDLDKQQMFPSIGPTIYYRFSDKFTNRNLAAFIQLETLFNFRRTHFNFRNFLIGIDHQEPIIKNNSWIRIPFYGGFEFHQFRLGFGPMFSFLVHEEKVFEDIQDLREDARSFEPAGLIMIGANFDNLMIDLSYEYHFNGVSEFLYYKGQISGFKDLPQFLSLSISYLLPFGK